MRLAEDADEMRDLGFQLARVLLPGDLVILAGPLGAGKTTFTQGVGAGLGVTGPVTSPTFVISRVYPGTEESPSLVHVDAYRLGSALEVEDLDLEESMAQAVTVVEWGAGTFDELASSPLYVTLDRGIGTDSGDARTVTWRATGDGWIDRVAALTQVLG